MKLNEQLGIYFLVMMVVAMLLNRIGETVIFFAVGLSALIEKDEEVSK